MVRPTTLKIISKLASVAASIGQLKGRLLSKVSYIIRSVTIDEIVELIDLVAYIESP